MVWGDEPLDPNQLDNGQWYPPHGERYFMEITEEEAVPAGVNRGTYIDPDWHWWWKLLKRLAPHDVKIGVALYILIVGLTAPSLYRWATKDLPDLEVDDEDHPWATQYDHSLEDARRMLGDWRAERERIERERVENERAERERAESERAERERVERERVESERAELERGKTKRKQTMVN